MVFFREVAENEKQEEDFRTCQETAVSPHGTTFSFATANFCRIPIFLNIFAQSIVTHIPKLPQLRTAGHRHATPTDRENHTDLGSSFLHHTLPFHRKIFAKACGDVDRLSCTLTVIFKPDHNILSKVIKFIHNADLASSSVDVVSSLLMQKA